MNRTTKDDRHAVKPLPSSEEIAALPPDGGEEFNRLIHESSPYLLQHARNPVDWYPWGDEAFQKARREDKPVFLSIGYSTCHWCHVMERESFEHDEIAAILNRDYVSIKVDREERPDVDHIYMAAVQAVTGSGGWPMSVFLTADREPFLVGTYFPPEDRFGRPGFRSLLQRVTDAWKGSREELLEGATRLTEHLRESRRSPEAGPELGEETLRSAFEQLSSQLDRSFGGFGNAPKFPRSHTLSFLLRYADRAREGSALGMALATLDAMGRGGIRDHLGGGFHRYSTDRYWLVPHFEKMLYDQALLVRSYLEAYQATGRESYAPIARDTLEYVLRDLRDPRGGFHSAEDADSEGEEGKFYIWTRAEVLEHLGSEDGHLFTRVYGVTEDGNFREEASGLLTGANILHVPRSLEDVAREESMEPEELGKRLEPLRMKLFEIRERRVHPHKDDKVLADWNGLMISALAHASRVLAEPRYLDAAREAARFVLSEMRRDGRLLHVYRDGKASVLAYLDDYAFLSLALLDLYEADLDPSWLEASVGLAKEMVRLFWDDGKGGFLFSGSDAERLIAQTKEVYDGAVPSGNSVAAYALLRLGRLTGDAELEEKGRKTLEAFSTQVGRIPMAHPFFLMALDFAIGPTQEIVLAGSAEDPALQSMRRAIDTRFLPRLVLLHHPTGPGAERIEALAPFTREQAAREGKPTAYVCENHACKAPVTTVAELEALLGDGK